MNVETVLKEAMPTDSALGDDFPGMRRFYSEDPHGNRLEFLEPIDQG